MYLVFLFWTKILIYIDLKIDTLKTLQIVMEK